MSTQPSRRSGRARALQVLYAMEAQPDLTVAQALANLDMLGALPVSEGAEAPEPGAVGAPAEASRADTIEDQRFIERLVRGVTNDRVAIDDLLGQASRNWRLARMARIDRNVLRLATFELRSEDTPARVVLNEAIELGRRFGTSDSASFINGVLDRVVKVLGRSTESGPPRRA